ncbi:CinA family nicotinamide mononucleotide deamidase-related protein [Kiritimatiellota bacterium B12222]|nr:CinA family nicotinamide mononucleotide deamidase-related protein [Kiritimatiellota bacterium B12222]
MFEPLSSTNTSFTHIPLHVRGELYVSPMPYGRYDSDRVFRFFKQEEIQRAVILLSDSEIKKRCKKDLKKLYKKHKIAVTQFPMIDFLQPGHGDMDQLIPDIAQRLRDGERIVVHCHAGVGRSSVVIACLVAVIQHTSIEDSIEHVKSHMETNITVDQKRFIAGWIERLYEYSPEDPLVIRSAEVITTGSELLQGRTLNQHGFRLGALLTSFGIPMIRETVLPDNPTAIEDMVLEAVSRTDLVIVTGGLGPTDDDQTREAVARGLHRKVIDHAKADEHLTNYFVQLRRTPTKKQRRQAQVIEGATVYMNPVGIAPAQHLKLSTSRHLWLLPGPPRELDGLLESAVRPWLEQAITRRDHHQAIFRIVGQSESAIQDKVHKMNNFREVQIAYCSTPGSVELRFTGTIDRVTELKAQTLKAFGQDILNETGDFIEIELSEKLKNRGENIAVAESCTAGGIGERISSVPGSSDYFLGGIIAYANEVKINALDVSADTLEKVGAVSEEVAQQMAEGVRKRFNSDWGVSITGIAGPGGGSEEKPVGLFYVGISGKQGTRVRKYLSGGNRSQIREYGIQRAMTDLWRELTANP